MSRWNPNPYESTHVDPEVEAEAKRLAAMGYIGTSNKYRSLVRIDRPDWVKKMAREANCSVADFYDFSNGVLTNQVGMRHGEFYCRVMSRDRIEVSEEVYRRVKKLERYPVVYVETEAERERRIARTQQFVESLSEQPSN